ncbi:hypothetical protein ALQ97_102009 [Pseudomonas savastanoi pv. glycinea]|nr:hypothetical protein ALQ97_102009 [Pseudomonas savastanoi pv. glycinea]
MRQSSHLEAGLPLPVYRASFLRSGFLTVSTVVSFGLFLASSSGMKRPLTESLARSFFI